MKSAPIDLGPHHIGVTALVPGLIATNIPMHETRLKETYQDYHSDSPTGHGQAA